jgi:hypothetical protein
LSGFLGRKKLTSRVEVINYVLQRVDVRVNETAFFAKKVLKIEKNYV